MDNFQWTPEELADSKDMEERHKYKKWSEKYPILDLLSFIIFAPIFKIIEEITFNINKKEVNIK